jgi:hypothetical protein
MPLLFEAFVVDCTAPLKRERNEKKRSKNEKEREDEKLNDKIKNLNPID